MFLGFLLHCWLSELLFCVVNLNNLDKLIVVFEGKEKTLWFLMWDSIGCM